LTSGLFVWSPAVFAVGVAGAGVGLKSSTPDGFSGPFWPFRVGSIESLCSRPQSGF
jgi:hypothetical protein